MDTHSIAGTFQTYSQIKWTCSILKLGSTKLSKVDQINASIKALNIKSVRICAWFNRSFKFYLARFGGNNGLTQPWDKQRGNANLLKKIKTKNKINIHTAPRERGFYCIWHQPRILFKNVHEFLYLLRSLFSITRKIHRIDHILTEVQYNGCIYMTSYNTTFYLEVGQ